MDKYLLKFIKYILPSSKEWAGVGLLSYINVHLHSTSISRENIDIVLYIKLVLKSDTTITKTYSKRATSDDKILGILKETQLQLLSLLIIRDSQEQICISNSQIDFFLVLYFSNQLAL